MTERETETVTVETVTDHADPGGTTGETPKPTFSDAQQAEVNRLMAKTRRDAADKARADAKAERDAADAQTRTDADRKKAEERGEFDRVIADIERERDEANTKLDAANAKADRYSDAVAAFLDDDWQKLPDLVRDSYSGPDDDPLARLAWLPKGKALADHQTARGARGNGPDPAPGNGGAKAPTLEQTKREMAGLFGMSR